MVLFWWVFTVFTPCGSARCERGVPVPLPNQNSAHILQFGQSGGIHFTRRNTFCNLEESKYGGGGVHSSTAQSRLSSVEAGGGSAPLYNAFTSLSKFLNLPLVCPVLKAHLWSKVLPFSSHLCSYGPCVTKNRMCSPNQVLERDQIGCRVSYLLWPHM